MITEFMQELFKKDSGGRTRILRVYTSGDTLYQDSGIYNGALVKHEKVCKGKNIGRSNETTPEEQAILEAKSKVEEKLTTGYFKTLEELESGDTEVIMPMLAKSYGDVEVDWTRPVYVQPKLDGMRCLIIVRSGIVKLMSREGKEIITMDHIKAVVQNMVTPSSNFIMDGELYSHGLSFQENMRLIKKVRPETINVVYHMYDVVESTPFTTRYNTIQDLVRMFNTPYIELVSTKAINKAGLAQAHGISLSLGYEGTIVRWGTEGYQMGSRSKYLLKYKDFLDLDAEIIDVIPFESRPKQGVVVCKYKGLTFKATPKMSHTERELLLTNKKDIIGKKANIRYFELTDDGIPRFPIFCGVHEDR